MPVDHPVSLATAAASPRHVRKRAALLGFVLALTGFYVLGQVMDLGGLLS